VARPDLHRLDHASFACAFHLFDHLVGRLQEWLRDGEAKRIRSLEIDDEFVFGRLLDR
jgi:hypothetical protein